MPRRGEINGSTNFAVTKLVSCWEVRDSAGFLCWALPFTFVLVEPDEPHRHSYAARSRPIYLTPTLNQYHELSLDEQRRVEQIELCLSFGPLTAREERDLLAAHPGRRLYVVTGDSPWYVRAEQARTARPRARDSWESVLEAVMAPSPRVPPPAAPAPLPKSVPVVTGLGRRWRL